MGTFQRKSTRAHSRRKKRARRAMVDAAMAPQKRSPKSTSKVAPMMSGNGGARGVCGGGGGRGGGAKGASEVAGGVVEAGEEDHMSWMPGTQTIASTTTYSHRTESQMSKAQRRERADSPPPRHSLRAEEAWPESSRVSRSDMREPGREGKERSIPTTRSHSKPDPPLALPLAPEAPLPSWLLLARWGDERENGAHRSQLDPADDGSKAAAEVHERLVWWPCAPRRVGLRGAERDCGTRGHTHIHIHVCR